MSAKVDRPPSGASPRHAGGTEGVPLEWAGFFAETKRLASLARARRGQPTAGK